MKRTKTIHNATAIPSNGVTAAKPFVSVIIPVFNGARHLTEAVISVQRSLYKNYEILLIDDGSADKSKQLCRRLARKYKNVRFYDFPRNRGLGRVLNFALKKARGTYIARLNQDDRMLPNRLATQVRYLNRHKDVTAVGSSIIYFDDSGEKTRMPFLETDAEIKDMWYVVSPFSDPTVMYRKDVAIAVGGYDQNFWPADDTHLWYRMGQKGKLANLKKPVTEVRWHKGAASMVHFRKLAIKTYQMHLWTHEWVAPAPWYVHAYWLIQLVAGYTLSPQLNWNIYRVIKRFLYRYELLRERLLMKMAANPIVQKLTNHPAAANFSGA